MIREGNVCILTFQTRLLYEFRLRAMYKLVHLYQLSIHVVQDHMHFLLWHNYLYYIPVLICRDVKLD